MRIIAILAAYNEERFIAGCIEHYARQGVDVYLIDHSSTDQTVALAERYWHKGLIGLEHFPRNGIHEWQSILERKEVLAATLEADWFIHADPDEVRLAPQAGWTLAKAFEYVDRQGYNAVNFMEFTFIPVQEAPDHNHPDFQKTMRWYYPFLPSFPHCLKAWKRQPQPVELAWSAGHQVRFPGLRMYPESFPMRHYQFLSVAHALAKYTNRKYPSAAIEKGWHGWRASVQSDQFFQLPPKAELREYIPDRELDASQPRQSHYLADIVQAQSDRRSESPEASHVVCILGMHRSGTSLLTRLVNLLGVDLGPANESLMRAEDNLAGFWEHQEIVEINDQLLARLGGSWDRPPKFPPGWERDPMLADLRHQAQSSLKRFMGLALWGWKDPRTCLTLPFWQALITQPISYLICLRSPTDVAASLEQRNGFAFEKSVELWATYTWSAIEQTAARPRHFVFYEDFLGDAQPALQALAQFLGKSKLAEQAETRESIRRFINPDLQHHQTTAMATIADPRLALSAKALYSALYFAFSSSGQNPAETRVAVTQLAKQILNFQSDFDNLQNQASLWEKRALESEHLNRNLTAQLAEATELQRVLREREALWEKQAVENEQVIQSLNTKLAEATELQTALKEGEAHIERMYRSTSWRVTRPLRLIGDALQARNVAWLKKVLKRIFGSTL